MTSQDLKIHQSLISKYAICRMSGSGVIYPHDIRNNNILCIASNNSILMLLQLSGSILCMYMQVTSDVCSSDSWIEVEK